MKICFRCKEEKEDDKVIWEYGKNICKECVPSFRKEAKEEAKKIEEIF